MQTYKLLPHTGDVAIEVEADSLEELFYGALLGMNDILKKGICEHEMHINQTQDIEIASHDATTLLIDFLNEVLFHSNERKTVFCHLDFQHLDHQSLRAEIRGERIDHFDEEIKAVTYHGAQIMKKGELYEVQILFDI